MYPSDSYQNLMRLLGTVKRLAAPDRSSRFRVLDDTIDVISKNTNSGMGSCVRFVEKDGTARDHVVTPWLPSRQHPDCVCGRPLLLCVPPGQIAYPCRIHPERGIKGAEVFL